MTGLKRRAGAPRYVRRSALSAVVVIAAGAWGQVAVSPASARVVASKSTNIKRKPVIPRQQGQPPTQLVRQDIIAGSGRAARDGDDLRVKYILKLWTGKLLDDAWRLPAFSFRLGSGVVIKGWDLGLRGLRRGGRRQLTIPPRLAYGREGQGPIPPNATLVFIVDAVSVTPHRAGA
jgi:FKBP-type peptidyl-prolyl cis-trans isomerase